MRIPPGRLKAGEVDRETMCPLLLRLFAKEGDRNFTESDFQRPSTLPGGDIQIYTWRDATLGELSALLGDVRPQSARSDTVLRFWNAYPNASGKVCFRYMGYTTPGRRSDDDNYTLDELTFHVGDYVLVQIMHDKGQQRNWQKNHYVSAAEFAERKKGGKRRRGRGGDRRGGGNVRVGGKRSRGYGGGGGGGGGGGRGDDRDRQRARR